MFSTIKTIHFLKAIGPRISKLIIPSVSYTNTQIQIHKCTNTAYDEVPERPNMWYIFEKRIVQGYQKSYSHVSNAQIQKYKYTNTQIQHMRKCQKDPTCGIFLKRGLFKDIKNDITMCRTHKYKNTKTQIKHMTKCQKDPTCGIFLKRGFSEPYMYHLCIVSMHHQRIISASSAHHQRIIALCSLLS